VKQWWNWRKRDAELEKEIQHHLRMAEADRMERGASPGEARAGARREFGNAGLVKETARDVWGWRWLTDLMQDLRYGARTLRKSPGFTLTAILTLGLGIGVSDVAFTAYKAFFERTIDAREPTNMASLAMVLHSGATDPYFSYPDYEAYRDHLQSFSGLLAEGRSDPLSVSGAGAIVRQSSAANGSLAEKLGLIPFSTSHKELATAMMVSENYFSVLGVAPRYGRAFGDAGEPTAAATVLISENYWERRFGGDRAVLGQTIRLNGVAFTVAGITPQDFVGAGTDVADFWLPISAEALLHPDAHALIDREARSLRLLGRLAPGVSIEQAQIETNLLANRLSGLHDPHTDWGKPVTAFLWPGSPYPLPISRMAAGLRYAILLVMVAVGLVLVIACANVASLQLARATSRQNELCVRLSLGASRLRLVRQLLTESALLGLLAGAAALFLSWPLIKALATAASGFLPPQYGTVIFRVSPDLGIFSCVFAVSLAAGIFFGLAPALESSRSAISSALQAKGGTSAAGSRTLRDLFIAAQVTVALALMIAGSMLIRSSIHALRVYRGYDSKNVVNLDIQFPEDASYTAERKGTLIRELRTRLAALPGVAAVTNADAPVYGHQKAAVSLNGEAPSERNTRAVVGFSFVEPSYFETVGIPLLLGSNFSSRGGQPAPSVVVSESAAKELWPDQDPLGRRVRLSTDRQFHARAEVALPDGREYQVIGVSGDTRGATFDGSDSKVIYLQLPEDRIQDHAILVRTHSDAKQLIRSIGPLVFSVDPNLDQSSSSFEDMLRATVTFLGPSFAAAIATPVGVIGLLLASMGIYGTVSYVVLLRTREVGIRMALGAGRREVLALMLRGTAWPVLGGLLGGMVLAVGASYLLRGALHGLKMVDAVSFAGMSCFFLAVALFAAWVPSRRAMRVDPVVALRYE
jgi:predicted permease